MAPEKHVVNAFKEEHYEQSAVAKPKKRTPPDTLALYPLRWPLMEVGLPLYSPSWLQATQLLAGANFFWKGEEFGVKYEARF